MFILKSIARELILPPSATLILILVGAIAVWRGRRGFGWTLFAVGFMSLWLLCMPVVADGLSALAERYPALRLDRPVTSQAVIVLGGGGERIHAPEYEGPVVEPPLLERLALAAFLAHRYSLPLGISGAPGEAVAMAQTLSRNFREPVRWVEGNSRDTYENAQLSARMLFPDGIKRIILVTSSAHEWRAAHEFMAAGFDVVPAPVGVLAVREMGVFRYLPSSSALMRSHAAIYELIGEPMRRLQALSGIREKWDRNIQPGNSSSAAAASAR